MKDEIYVLIKELQFKSWWFNSRRKIIETFLKNIINVNNSEILDIGSGYGGFVLMLKNFGAVDIIEPYENAHSELLKLGIRKMWDITDFPINYPRYKYDIVTLFDVLEHIKEDSLTLKVVKEHLLKRNGRCFITVPAYMWLWSYIDDMGGHLRRYTKKDLFKLMQDAGFQQIKISYFMSFTLPMEMIAKAIRKIRANNYKNLNYNIRYPLLNKILESIMCLESKFISWMHFPCGPSIIATGVIQDNGCTFGSASSKGNG